MCMCGGGALYIASCGLRTRPDTDRTKRRDAPSPQSALSLSPRTAHGHTDETTRYHAHAHSRLTGGTRLWILRYPRTNAQRNGKLHPIGLHTTHTKEAFDILTEHLPPPVHSLARAPSSYATRPTCRRDFSRLCFALSPPPRVDQNLCTRHAPLAGCGGRCHDGSP